MASEYLKKKYKDVKPDVPRELTKEEKRRNWWDYHKWYVAGGVVGVLVLASMIWDITGRGQPKPDYQVAYVGREILPDDTISALEAAFAGMGEDLNGDGQVIVTLRQYVSYSNTSPSEEASSDESSSGESSSGESSSDESSSDESSSEELSLDRDPSLLMAATVQLMADISEQESFIFLLEDPEWFQQSYRALCYVDGTLPEEGNDSVDGIALRWTDCPALAGLDLGDYNYDLLGGEFTGSSQDLMRDVYVARRGFWKDKDAQKQDGYLSLWNNVIAGAVE